MLLIDSSKNTAVGQVAQCQYLINTRITAIAVILLHNKSDVLSPYTEIPFGLAVCNSFLARGPSSTNRSH